MKKSYIQPLSMISHIEVEQHILAGSVGTNSVTGDVESVSIGSGSANDEGFTLGARGGSGWDDGG